MRDPIRLSQLGDGGRADTRPVRHGSEEHGAAEVQSAAQETGICQQAAPQSPGRAWKHARSMLENSAFSGDMVIPSLLKYHDNTINQIHRELVRTM